MAVKRYPGGGRIADPADAELCGHCGVPTIDAGLRSRNDEVWRHCPRCHTFYRTMPTIADKRRLYCTAPTIHPWKHCQCHVPWSNRGPKTCDCCAGTCEHYGIRTNSPSILRDVCLWCGEGNDMERIATFEDALNWAMKAHGRVENAAKVLASSDPVYDTPARYRIVSTDGIQEIDSTVRFRRTVRQHWKAIYAYVHRGDAQQLALMAGTTVENFQLEYRPEMIAQYAQSDELQLPERRPPNDRNYRAPWNPRAEPLRNDQ